MHGMLDHMTLARAALGLTALCIHAACAAREKPTSPADRIPCPRRDGTSCLGHARAAIGARDPALPANTPATTCNPRNFGATADGQTNDQQAIQSAVDSCFIAGGGTVVLSGGVFLSGPVFLRTNITLQIDGDATLLATQDPAAYQRQPGMPDVGRSIVALVNGGSGETDLAITGSGTIDGAGDWWWRFHLTDRPRLVVFYRCQRVLIDGVTLTNSPSFHLVPARSEDVTIRNVYIVAPADSPNTDGIDPSDSRNVSISDSTIDVGDDNIAVKAGHLDAAHPGESSADITVTGCTFLHGHGMSIGSETLGGVRRMTVSGCTFRDTISGIRIKTNRDVGGEVAFITYRDLTMVGVRNPIALTAYYPDGTVPAPGTDPGQPMTDRTPNYHDIQIENVAATGTNSAAGRVIGVPEIPFNNISLTGVQISGVSTGLVVRNASLTTHDVQITPQRGAGFALQEGAQITEL